VTAPRAVRDRAAELVRQELAVRLSHGHDAILRSTADLYRKIIGEALAADPATGKAGQTRAAQRALDRIAHLGVVDFVDQAGRRWTMQSYVEMAVRTAALRARTKAHLDVLRSQGIGLVYVTNHAGQCPLCRPWESQVLAIDEATGEDAGGQRVDHTVADAIAAGLMHPNCKHGLKPWRPGTIVPEATPDPEGYAAEQELRRLERGVRQWKAREAAALTPDAAAKARAKVEVWQDGIRRHVDATGVGRVRGREQTDRALAAPATRTPHRALAPVDRAAPRTTAVADRQAEQRRVAAQARADRKAAEAAAREQAAREQAEREQAERDRVAAEQAAADRAREEQAAAEQAAAEQARRQALRAEQERRARVIAEQKAAEAASREAEVAARALADERHRAEQEAQRLAARAQQEREAAERAAREAVERQAREDAEKAIKEAAERQAREQAERDAEELAAQEAEGAATDELRDLFAGDGLTYRPPAEEGERSPDHEAFLERFADEQRPEHQGMSAYVRIVTDPDTGQQLVYKRAQYGETDEIEAEVLGALIGRAVGANVPRVWRLDDDAVAMEFVPGHTAAAELLRLGLNETQQAAWWQRSDGDRLAVMDYIAENRDRNSGNAMVDPDGRVWGIDHGNLLPAYDRYNITPPPEADRVRSEFGTRPWERPGVTVEMLDEIGPRLAELREQFDRVGGDAPGRHVRLMQRFTMLRDEVARRDT
jgi:hypothetical protein